MTIEEYKTKLEHILMNCTFRDCDPAESRQHILEQIDCGELYIRLFQYRFVDDGCVEGLKSGTIKFTSPNRFNDPYDSLIRWNEQSISEYFNNPRYSDVLAKHWIVDNDTFAVSIRNRFRISCFSEVSDSPLMWAHYANKGKGFCVEYEFPVFMGSPLCLKNGNPCARSAECNPIEC